MHGCMLNANIVPHDLLCSYKYTESSGFDSSLHVTVRTEFSLVYTPGQSVWFVS